MEVTFRGPAEPASLKGVHALLAEVWAGEPGVAPRDRMLFATAVAEVATNIIKHGQPGAQSELVLTVRVDADTIEADFADNGVEADLSLADDSPAHEMSESGRGLHIARATLDDLSYERAGGVNRWHLVRRRS